MEEHATTKYNHDDFTTFGRCPAEPQVSGQPEGRRMNGHRDRGIECVARSLKATNAGAHVGAHSRLHRPH